MGDTAQRWGLLTDGRGGRRWETSLSAGGVAETPGSYPCGRQFAGSRGEFLSLWLLQAEPQNKPSSIVKGLPGRAPWALQGRCA